ncbi:hypothetical protein OIU74_015983, partial [Salix koriyanagi]
MGSSSAPFILDLLKRAPLDDTTNQKNATQKGSRNFIPSSTLKQKANSSSVKTK